MKQTVLHETHKKLGAKMAPFAGYDMPISYTSIQDEHMMVREKAGLFDVSHMGEICVKGKEASKLVDYLFTNDITSMTENQVLYGFMCYPDGGVVDDLLVYKFSNEHFLLVVNASNIEKDFKWVTTHNSFDTKVTNESENFSQLALQGPKAETILQQLTDFNLSSFPFFHSQTVTVNDKLMLISRTGYTGEDGFEIYGTHDDIKELFEKLLDVGEEDIAPIGLGARDTLRFEVTLPLYGNELSKDITPLEAGYGFAVKLEAEDFIGKKALKKQKQEKTKRRLCGLELKDRGILRHGYTVYKGDKKVGTITT
ncbi:MAG: glycine cleavage system aminomethyltransferase GcvT, partial [Candidatus Izimaplasma sp.]|nr:glycine cleavage system aminomethyltransferase GcvT [Candidatus Izimaplasma bacterium]